MGHNYIGHKYIGRTAVSASGWLHSTVWPLPILALHIGRIPRMYGLAGHYRTWPGASLLHMAWRVTSVHGLVGHYCTWPGGSLLHMAWRVNSVHGLAGLSLCSLTFTTVPGGSVVYSLACTTVHGVACHHCT